MSKLTGCTTLKLFVIGLAISTAWGMEPPHDESYNIGCVDCHAMYSSGFVPRNIEQENLCKSCHNPTGLAASMSDVAVHTVDANTIIDCGSCHEVHTPSEPNIADPHPGGQTAPNLKLIRGDTGKYVPGALGPAVFQERPAHFAFDANNAPWDGVCQSCHTQTKHHTNNGAGDHQHKIGLDCTTCHSHKSGFASIGGCTSCHNLPQGSRRQIVEPGGDFSRASHHIVGTVQDVDCEVCHDTSVHQSGTVRLKDPDQGAAIIYSYNPADPAAIENFCLNCHDSDGAMAEGGTQPFSDGTTVPNIKGSAVGSWANSAHKQIGYGPNGGNPISCFGNGSSNGCHGNAHGSNLRKMLGPYNGTPGTDNVNEEEGFCYNCHGAGGVTNEAISNGWFAGTYQNFADSVQGEFNMDYSHPVNDSEPGHVFDIGSGPQELECTTCHNVHQATGKHWGAVSGYTPVNILTTGQLWGDQANEKIGMYDPNHTYLPPFLGEFGLNLSGNPLPIDANGDSLLTYNVLPNYNTFCLRCHQNPVGSLVAVNWATKHHGSGEAEPLGPAGWELATPFDSNNRGQYYLDCLDCHEAHGSQNYMILKQSINGEVVGTIIDDTTDKYWRSVCDRCHVSDPRARHHNDDVWCNKLGMCDGWPDCSVCHGGMHGSIYSNCVSPGCHGHNDFF